MSFSPSINQQSDFGFYLYLPLQCETQFHNKLQLQSDISLRKAFELLVADYLDQLHHLAVVTFGSVECLFQHL
jgi:hypothetical protein